MNELHVSPTTDKATIREVVSARRVIDSLVPGDQMSHNCKIRAGENSYEIGIKA